MSKEINKAIELLQAPQTIRVRSKQLFERALENHSPYFNVELTKLDSVVTQIKELIEQYPSIENIPFHSRWRHFEAGNLDRIGKITNGREAIELVILSVLLDAGAGENWSYYEAATDQNFARSEGLAIATLEMYRSGLFSDKETGTVSASSLDKLTLEVLEVGFQVSSDNPMTALEGRLSLLKNLSRVLACNPTVFGEQGELGLFFDYLEEQAANSKTLSAAKVLKLVLNTFSDIWPGRVVMEGVNLGDVWKHSLVSGEGKTNGLIPFHKLSQWLSYSLLEPFIWQGYSILDLEQLTGLPEYRNGGLFLDSEVITLKDTSLTEKTHPANSELIIEWRALTICLLDALWEKLLLELSLSKEEFPQVKMLEAGSWKAGRILAYQNRNNGAPPLQLQSDGTVF